MRKIITWIAVLLWMTLIFYMSSQPDSQSGKLSYQITKYSIKAINKVEPNTKIKKQSLDSIIRKNAHFFLYLCLSMLALNVLRRSGVVRYKSIALLLCVLYAISDEIHQVFVPGRGPGVRDVFIDSAGAFVGILVYLVITKKISSSKYFRPIKE